MKKGLFERLYSKAIWVKLSHSAVLCIKECAVIEGQLVLFAF